MIVLTHIFKHQILITSRNTFQNLTSEKFHAHFLKTQNIDNFQAHLLKTPEKVFPTHIVWEPNFDTAHKDGFLKSVVRACQKSKMALQSSLTLNFGHTSLLILHVRTSHKNLEFDIFCNNSSVAKKFSNDRVFSKHLCVSYP